MALCKSAIEIFSLCFVLVVVLSLQPGQCHSDQLRASLQFQENTALSFLLGTGLQPENKVVDVLTSLLPLFDLQEKVQRQLNVTSGDESDNYQFNPTLTDMDVLLERVIQDTCKYVNETLHNNISTEDGVDLCNRKFMLQTFDCSRDAVERLQVNLEIYKTSKEAYILLGNLNCTSIEGCRDFQISSTSLQAEPDTEEFRLINCLLDEINY